MPSCQKFFDALVECLRVSDCVKEAPHHTVKECLDAKYDGLVNHECRKAQQAYNECKLHLLSPRRRFRGPYGGLGDQEDTK